MNAFDFMAQTLEKVSRKPDDKERRKEINRRYYENHPHVWLIERAIRQIKATQKEKAACS